MSLRYYITDRKALGGEEQLIRNVERLGSNIDYVQIREKDLSANALAKLTRRVLCAIHPSGRVFVNDRADVAIACGAHGVHLRSGAIAPELIRRHAPPGFQIGVSCHSAADVARAAVEGANLVLFAPIFETPGKGPALGLPALAEAARSCAIPVIALGGITPDRVSACIDAGAAGIAGIRMFQRVIA